MTRWRPSPCSSEERIRWIRVLAAPFALADAALEDWPPGHEEWAWALTALLVVGSVVLALAPRVPAPVALGLDLVVVSGFVALYGFEPNSPVRLLFVLTALEGGLLLGRWGGVAAAVASLPALAVFEWRSAERLDAPFDVGHVLGPLGIQVLVALVVAMLAARRREGGG